MLKIRTQSVSVSSKVVSSVTLCGDWAKRKRTIQKKKSNDS